MMITINGSRLYVEDHGPRDGIPIIVHHGGPGLGDHREPRTAYALPFSDRYRVIVFDARGSGQSEGRPPLTHEQWVADVEGLRRYFGFERFVMAGGSYGGFIALEYAIRHQDRLLALILRDTAADSSHDEAAHRNALQSARVKVDRARFDRIMQGRCLSDEDFKECYKEILPLYNAEWNPEQDAARLERMIFRHKTHNFAFTHNFPNYDVKPYLPGLQVPTLIIVGRHDWITPVAASEDLHRLIPGSRLEIFEHSGHSPQLEEPEKFQRVVREFLAEHVDRPGPG